MYEARQYKDKVSRRIVNRENIKGNYNNTNSIYQFAIKNYASQPKLPKIQQSQINLKKNTQFKIQSETFKIDTTTRFLHFDDRGYFSEHGATTNKYPISIVYETIGEKNDAEKCIDNYRKMHFDYPNSPVGLSIVINEKIGERNEVDRKMESLLINTENVPNINIEYVLWEYDTEKALVGQIPYYSLRRRAVVNDGAQNLYDKMSRLSDVVWRKMGDSDMKFHSPFNTNDIQIIKLQSDNHYRYKDRVTFGYILNDGMEYIINLIIKSKMYHKESNCLDYGPAIYYAKIISDIIDYIYKKEMELRENINYKYPIEPTTYYKLDKNKFNKLPIDEEKQIREGETFMNKIFGQTEKNQIFDGRITERTSAGKRNDVLIEYLINKLLTKQALYTKDLYRLITNLNQSVFNPQTKITHNNQGIENKSKILNDIITYIANKSNQEMYKIIISQMNERRYQQLDIFKSTPNLVFCSDNFVIRK